MPAWQHARRGSARDVLLLTAATAASTILVLDAVGLVVFTIGGREVALQMSQPLLIIVGVGGVLRDILCNDVPAGDSLSLGDAEIRLLPRDWIERSWPAALLLLRRITRPRSFRSKLLRFPA